MLNFLVDPLNNLEEYAKLKTDIESNISPIATYGIIDESIGHILYALKEHTNRQMLFITYDEARSRRVYEDIKNIGYNNVHLLPKKDIVFYEIDAFSYENTNQRLGIIHKLLEEENVLIITSIEAIFSKFMSKDTFKSYSYDIKSGEDINLNDLMNTLLNGGYERVNMVESVGQFSLRGGIIDFFPPYSPNPIRIELFDEEVDSIRTFDLLNQRSLDILDETFVFPVKEVLLLEEHKPSILKALDKELKSVLSKSKVSELEKEKISNKFERYKEKINENLYISNRDMILPYIDDKYISSLFDYLKSNAIIYVDEPKRIEEAAKNILNDFSLKFNDFYEAGELLPSHTKVIYDFESLVKQMEQKQAITNSALVSGANILKPKAIYNFTVKGMQSYHKKLEILKEDINHFKYRGYKILILSGTEDRGRRLHSTLAEMNVESSFIMDKNIELKSSQVFITPGSINGGFEYPKIKFIVISDKEIFGAAKKKKGIIKKKDSGKSISFSDLNIGDFVVHENHGIGKYEGVEQLNIQGLKKDYLTIRYKGEDKLYVPIDQMHLIQKYIGSDSIKPKINKLSSAEWARTKEKAKKAVEDMAVELLELYAKRESYKGFAFSPDGEWQRQFEDLFPYEETDGQLTSIFEIKEDMQKDKPMDRLLCGDVGYGKTEVAVRAIFKAVMDGKQVAFLVPTTILAQQHYNTLVERFANFPIKVATLSRFRNKNEQKLAIENTRTGVVDVVVGTHRLLSKDVQFKDLGLLVIDEEQRFGVKHKEALKKFKETVDVLTLTATPIPRTLHMSLSGIRDMSVIEDPPEERYPVQTYVVEFNEQMIRDAIVKEKARGGQIYFVYNRVETIDKMAAKIKKMAPEVNIAIAHGQMSTKELEVIMEKFIEKEVDLLLCTTIIETGLDIPNVNTIIIHDADKMGLSQLYQLRGRVGRSNRIAYGYFTYEKDKVLSEVAEKRLRAIKEFTEFGSGFKIAMRDLEIRGAGNLLGAEQHGHMESIGYDLYVKFLSEAIRKLKGEKVVDIIDTTMDIKVDGYIKKRYIEDEEQKIEVYKKIASITSLTEYRELLDELIDRFGDLPKEVENLMDISYIRYLASKNNIKNIVHKDKEIRLEFNSTDKITPELLNYLSKEYIRRIMFNLSTEPYFIFKIKDDILDELKKLVEKINSFNDNQNNI